MTRDATALATKLGRSDARKLDEYMTGVREVERRLAGESAVVSCTQGPRPLASYAFQDLVDIMGDLMVLAMQCDATRVITFMLGNAGSQQSYPALGITRGHHEISHHNNDPVNLDQLQTIGTWEVDRFARLLSKMKATTEGDTNMLFNSAVFFSSEISDGNRHNHDDMPILLAGHGGGALHPAGHVTYAAAKHERVSNLLCTMLRTVGVEGPVGDSNGVILAL